MNDKKPSFRERVAEAKAREEAKRVAAGKPIATFAPTLRSVKLYADGQIEYQGKRGSIVGASARVDASGSKRLLQDTREVFLIVEGPRVSIVASLGSKGHLNQKGAQQFAAKVNQLAMQLGGAGMSSGAAQQPAPEDDVLDQLERLGKLHDSGVLTEDEFKAQKAGLLGRSKSSHAQEPPAPAPPQGAPPPQPPHHQGWLTERRPGD